MMAMADEELHTSQKEKRLHTRSLTPLSPGLGSLPEPCIAIILSHTTPLDACRLSSVNRLFKSASDSDVVWERMLPPRFADSSRNDGAAPRFPSKKALFRSLCYPTPLSDGNQKYWLDPCSGGECYMLSARALEISSNHWSWHWIPRAGSWFYNVAFFKLFRLLEIEGRFQQYLKPGTYTVSFRFQMGIGNWRNTKFKFSLSASNGRREESSKFLSTRLFLRPMAPPRSSYLNPLMFTDDWIERDAGEFIVDDNKTPVELRFSMTVIDALYQKDLILDGVLIRPSDMVNQSREKKSVGMRPKLNMACKFIPSEGHKERTLPVDNGNASRLLQKRRIPWQPLVRVLKPEDLFTMRQLSMGEPRVAEI